jgi:hypothetical protein
MFQYALKFPDCKRYFGLYRVHSSRQTRMNMNSFWQPDSRTHAAIHFDLAFNLVVQLKHLFTDTYQDRSILSASNIFSPRHPYRSHFY